MRTKALIAAALLASALVGAGGFAAWSAGRNGPRVATYRAVEQPITQTLLVTGRVVAPGRVDLGAAVQSTVAEVPVDAGDDVEANALLVQLADDEVLARRHEAEARVAEAAARLKRVQGVGRQVADERLTQARIEAEEAERTYDRVAQVYPAGASEAQLDSARQARDGARSRLVAAQLEAAAAGGADTAAAAAALAGAQAALEVAQAAVARTQVRAPAAGRVLQRTVEPGQVVRPGDVLVAFAPDGAPELRITPDEVHLGRLAVGQPAEVVTDAFPARPFRATVAHIAPGVDPSRGTVEVRLALADEVDDLPLRPDMTATVEVVLGDKPAARLLPTHLVRDHGTGAPWVLVAVDGVAERRPVTLGLEGTTALEIVDGLGPDDAVLPVDADLGPGDPVRARPPVPALPAEE